MRWYWLRGSFTQACLTYTSVKRLKMASSDPLPQGDGHYRVDCNIHICLDRYLTGFIATQEGNGGEIHVTIPIFSRRRTIGGETTYTIGTDDAAMRTGLLLRAPDYYWSSERPRVESPRPGRDLILARDRAEEADREMADNADGVHDDTIDTVPMSPSSSVGNGDSDLTSLDPSPEKKNE